MTKTLQEAFDFIVTNLRKQGRPSISEGCDDDSEETGCAYRGADGMKCAIGFLIKDRFYRPEMEGFGPVLGHSIATAVKRSGWPCETDEHVRFYTSMQRIHDSAGYEPLERVIPLWERKWKEIADAYGLVYTPPKTNPCALD